MEHGDTIYVGKNLDWPVGDGLIMVNQRGQHKFSMVSADTNPVYWVSKYGSVTFNQFGKEFPIGGINEAGLVVEETSYSPAKFASHAHCRHINEFQWIQYQLDNYASVDEVLIHINELCIEKLLFGLHFFISDCHGKCAVVEFINNHFIIYTGKHLPFEVLSNNSYENSLEYLQKFNGYGGDLLIKNRSGSQERFVWAANQINVHKTGYDVKKAFGILDSVKQADTQWSIIYLPVQSKIFYSIKGMNHFNSIVLEQLNFAPSEQNKCILIGQSQNKDKFLVYNNKKNKCLLEQVFFKLVKQGEILPENADKIQLQMMHYQNHMNSLDGN